jgi:hypothetical protein
VTNKDKYRSLCRTELSIPIFSRDWWLDTVCGEDKWDVLLHEEKGRIRAAMPLYLPLRNIVSMPPYTQTMGPWFAEETADTKYTTAFGRRQTIGKTFVGELEKYTSFLQNFHCKATDWLPFYWAGYRQTTRYTYLLRDIGQTGRLWENMSLHARRNIAKATKQRLAVERDIRAEDFLRVQALSFGRQGRKPMHAGTLRQLITVCRERGQGDLWGGYDANGRLHAAAFIVWQDSSAYYLAGGADPALRHSGAHALVLWEAIRAVAKHTGLFDFEGSMLPGVERFFREFGAVQTPYFTIRRGKISLWNRAVISYQSRVRNCR